TIKCSETDTLLSLTTISFDIFVLESFLPLSKGTHVLMGSEDEQMYPETAARTLQDFQVTIFQSTPSRLTLLVELEQARLALMSLEYLLIGGEALPPQLLEKARALTHANIYNMYGPTETTVWSSMKNVSAGKSLNIGKPILNTVIHILDKNDHLQPVGVAGELLIGGDGLARGYLNRPELNDEKFVQLSVVSSILYRTGDLARWLGDGNIECLGRVDFQVKIRGFRVELGEIEHHLDTHPGIKESVVISRNDTERDYLCAYFTASGKKPELSGWDQQEALPVSLLKEYLEGRLPAYMVPSCFVKLETLPLNSSGKTARNKLPPPSESDFHSGGAYEPPESTMQQIIAEIWQDVLGREKVGIHDNFFDLGGNSMDFVKISNKLKEKLDREISVATLFTYPTIHSLELFLTIDQEAEDFQDITPDDSEMVE
ncbi:MAG: non-ribosomal peptide synthetase, partial [bacterium]|nr:non-ribosomal peptide synthetase [bacterium]